MRMRTFGVLALLGLALIASGCSSSNTPSSTPTKTGKLVIWADDKRAAVLKTFKAKFEQDTGVTVDIQAISKDQQTTFVTASQQGSGPDIMVGAHDWIGNLVQNGAIDPVQMTDAQKAAFASNAVKAVTFNGQVYGVPYAVENLALIRNTDLAPTAPTTIEELVSMGQQLKTQKKASEILCLQSGQNGDAYHIYPLYTSAGGYLFGTKANGDYDPKDLGVGKPESVAAFNKIAALGEKGSGALKRSITGDNSIATFTSKKCAFLVSGPWAITDVKKASIKYDITAIPPFAGGKPAQPFIGVQAFYVAAKGKNKALAQEFVTNYLTQPGPRGGAVPGRAASAGADGGAATGTGDRPGPAEVPRRRQERPRPAGHPRDGDRLGPVRQGGGGHHRWSTGTVHCGRSGQGHLGSDQVARDVHAARRRVDNLVDPARAAARRRAGRHHDRDRGAGRRLVA